MRLNRCLLLAAAMLSPSIAYASPNNAPAPSAEIRLSEAEKEKILDAAAAGRGVPSPYQADEADLDDQPARQVHGEVGFTVGTGGYRSAYGTAVVPLDGDGVAIISLGTTDFGSRARYFDPWWR